MLLEWSYDLCVLTARVELLGGEGVADGAADIKTVAEVDRNVRTV